MKHIIRHYFTPHHKNNFRAKLLHFDVQLWIIGLLLILNAVIHTPFIYENNILGFATDVTVTKLHEMVNEERAKYGLSPLSINSQLTEAAQLKAQDMFTDNYWAHFSPSGKTPWDFIKKAGYNYKYAGENLAKNFLFSDGVVKGWMNSPTHRANILRSEYKDVGYAVVNGTLQGEETTLVVQLFGSKPDATLIKGAEAQEPLPTQRVIAALPTAIPTLTPTPVLPAVTTAATPSAPLDTGITEFSGIGTTNEAPPVSGRKVVFYIALALFILFTIALFTDWYLAAHHKLVRTHSRNIAHILFIAIMVSGFILMTQGAVAP